MAVDHNNPQSRDEEILIATIDGNEYNKLPQSRMEELLLELKDVIEEGSGGGSVHFVVVEELPTTDIDQTAIYLVPKSTAATSNVYDEYINTDGTTSGWELIGSTDIDLSNYITDSDLATILEDYATEQDLSGKQDTLTAGKYINIDANNEIKVERVIPNEAFTYTIKQIDDYSFEVIKTVDNVDVFDEIYSCWDPETQQQMDVDETFDDAINIHIFPAGERSYTLLIASDDHEAGFKQTTPWWQRNTFVENFSTVDHSGEKLIIKSELDTAINAIKDGQSIDSFADVETALADKQDVLSAGSHISIDDDLISVNRWAMPAGKVVYTVITSDENYGQNVHVQRHTLSGGFIDDRTFTCVSYQTVNVDGLISIQNPYASFNITLLANSDEHQSGYSYTVNPISTPTSNSFTFLMDQEENPNDLIIRSEFGTKADLTNLAPAFSTSTAYTVGQYVSYDGNIYKCTSAHSAGAWVAGDFTLVAVGSELTSKQDATDNNLQTTDKTVVGAVNELKSGLTNLDVALSVPENSGKNILQLTIDNVKKYTDYAVWSGNSVTIKGVTYTFDVDDNGSVTKIHAEGTATDGDAWLTLYRENTAFGNCILSGCPSGGSEESYILAAYKSNPSVWYYDRGTGVSIPNNVTIEQVYINIANGYAIPSGGIDFYPMIRPATITDPTFAPYIPSVESRIEAVESKMQTDTFSGTTDAYGNISLGNYRYVIAAYAGGYVCIPFEYNYTRYIKILSTTTFEAVANTSVAGGYTYLDS